jgi:hypothetical protein
MTTTDFYLREISGEFGLSRFSFINKYYKKKEEKDRPEFFQGENLLRNICLNSNTRTHLYYWTLAEELVFLNSNIVIEL